MTKKQRLASDTKDLTGKTVAITGATGGLGGALCRHLLSLGADLILLDRNPQKSDALKTALLAEYPQAKIRQIGMDLTDLGSVKAACNALEEMGFSVLIHNAGAYSVPRFRCDTGFDNVFQINFFAPYFMTVRLLPYLRAHCGHVVAVGSIAHTYSKTDPADVDFSTRNKASLVYGNAKRYLMYAMHDLFRHETEATFALAHPGITFTNITAHYPPLLFALIKHPMKVIFPPPKKAALCILRGVFESTPDRTWWGPRCCGVLGRPKLTSLKDATKEEQKQILETVEKIRQGEWFL